MGTLASELGDVAGRLAGAPRVYADANLPAPLVRFMRERLKWDVLFVIEDDGLRRASDREHYRRSVELGRTLVTLDRDYLDDRRFPPAEGGGVLVLTAPREDLFERLLRQVDQTFFRDGRLLPLAGRKLHVHTDWSGDAEPA